MNRPRDLNQTASSPPKEKREKNRPSCRLPGFIPWSSEVLISCGLLTLTACDRSTRIGADYALVASGSSSSGPGFLLLYRGRTVWPRVYGGSEKSLHDGVFVFAAPVPDETGNVDFGNSIHLYAIRGEGPAVLISERIYGQPRDSSWQVRHFDAEAGGITVLFNSGLGSTNLTQVTHVTTWAEIEQWLLEAQGASAEKVTPLATYRVLLFKSATNDSSMKGAQPLDALKGFGDRPQSQL